MRPVEWPGLKPAVHSKADVARGDPGVWYGNLSVVYRCYLTYLDTAP